LELGSSLKEVKGMVVGCSQIVFLKKGIQKKNNGFLSKTIVILVFVF
jgi:hypothetical protein